MMRVADVYVCSWILIVCFFGVTISEERLLQANVYFRHADRSPMKAFPNNPIQESDWPSGFGQLLKRGMKREFELGKYFKSRYAKLLGDSYNRKDVYVRSSDKDRTLQSAEAFLAGMFPPSKNENPISEIGGIGWQPIPVHTVDKDTDELLRRGTNCPLYKKMFQKDIWITASEALEEEKNFGDFWKEVLHKSGVDQIQGLVNGMYDYWWIAHSLIVQKHEHKPMPDWVTPEMMRHFRHFRAMCFQFMGYNVTMARLAAGNLLGKIRNDMQKAIDKVDPVQKLFLYSGHDDGIAPFLSTLKLFTPHIPNFACAVILELLEDDERQEPFVRIFYRNDTGMTPSEPPQLKHPDCEADCPWSKFVAITKPFIPVDYHAECELEEDDEDEVLREKRWDEAEFRQNWRLRRMIYKLMA